MPQLAALLLQLGLHCRGAGSARATPRRYELHFEPPQFVGEGFYRESSRCQWPVCPARARRQRGDRLIADATSTYSITMYT